MMLRRTKVLLENKEKPVSRNQAIFRNMKNNCADVIQTDIFNPPATARFHCPGIPKIQADDPRVSTCLTSRETHGKNLKPIQQTAGKILSPRQLAYARIKERIQDGTFCSPVGPSTKYFWKKGQAQDKPLGSGYTSTVYRGIDIDTGDAVAVKLVPKKKQRLLSSEIYYRRLYQWLPLHQHPNILRLRDFFEDSHNFYIVSDLYTGPDLVDYVLSFAPQSIPSKCIKRVTIQLLLGLHHLHSSGLLHRDLKLDNIIFSNESKQNVIIVDFDMSFFFFANRSSKQQHPVSFDEMTIVGTKDYMAPENYRGIYSEASDLWSLGVILFILLDGHFPFDLSYASTPREIREILRRGVKFAPELLNKHPKATDLVQQLLVFDPQNRLHTVEEALMHTWFDTEHLFIRNLLKRNKSSQTCTSESTVQRNRLPQYTFENHVRDQNVKQNFVGLPSCFPQFKKFTKKINAYENDILTKKNVHNWTIPTPLDKISSISTMSTTTEYCAPCQNDTIQNDKNHIADKQLDKSKVYDVFWPKQYQMHNTLIELDLPQIYTRNSVAQNDNTLITYRRNF